MCVKFLLFIHYWLIDNIIFFKLSSLHCSLIQYHSCFSEHWTGCTSLVPIHWSFTWWIIVQWTGHNGCGSEVPFKSRMEKFRMSLKKEVNCVWSFQLKRKTGSSEEIIVISHRSRCSCFVPIWKSVCLLFSMTLESQYF